MPELVSLPENVDPKQLKQRMVDALEHHIIPLFNEASKAGFELNFTLGTDAMGRSVIAGIKVAKVY